MTGPAPESHFADLDSRERFERNWNRLQTYVELRVAAIVLAGVAGLLGTGPLSPCVSAFTGASLTMTYDRVVRRTVERQITIRTTEPLPGRTLEIALPNAIAIDVDVVTTSPRSSAMRAEADSIVYTFDIGAARNVTFSVKARTPGYIDAVVRSGEAQARFHEIVLP